MGLFKGFSPKSIQKNIATESKDVPIKQAVAIAYSVARKAAKKKGKNIKGLKNG